MPKGGMFREGGAPRQLGGFSGQFGVFSLAAALAKQGCGVRYEMDSKLVTIFGGSGFLGRQTVRALAKAGWRIRVAVRHPNMTFFLKPTGTVGQIAAVKCDVTDPTQVAASLQGAEAAVNLAGILFPSGQGFEEVHAEGAGNVAAAAAAAGVKALVHVSAI